MGTSGSGKSTLLNILGCLDTPHLGRILPRRHPGTEHGQKTSGRCCATARLVSYSSLTTCCPRRPPSKTWSCPSCTTRPSRPASGTNWPPGHSMPWDWPNGKTTSRTRCRADSSNVWPLPGRWSTTRSSFWPTRLPVTLDTRTSFEILVLFQELHDRGRTIIFVTHNPELSAYSSRNIVLRDGKIISDTPNDHPASALEMLKKTTGRKAIKEQTTMNLTNLTKIALKALNNNKMRCFLTMLGIIIGVASVITMLAIGQGSKRSIRAQIAEMGVEHDYDSPRQHGAGRRAAGCLVDADPQAQRLPGHSRRHRICVGLLALRSAAAGSSSTGPTTTPAPSTA